MDVEHDWHEGTRRAGAALAQMGEELPRVEIAQHHTAARSCDRAERPLRARTRSDLIKLVEPRLISGKARAVGLRMPQMQHAGGKAPVLAPDAGADHADHDIGVLEPPAREGRLESVHAFEIARWKAKLPPRTPCHLLPKRLRSDPSRRRSSGSSRLMLPRARCRAPIGDCPMLRLKLVREDVLGERARQQYAVAADEEALFGKPAMSRDEVRPRDAVAVEERQDTPPLLATNARFRISASLKPRSACQTCLSVTPSFDLHASITSRVAEPDPSSATTTSKRLSLCRESERSVASSASGRL